MKAGLLIFAMAESLSTRLRFLQSVVAPSTAAIGNDGVDDARAASGSMKSGARMVVVRATV